MNFDAYAAWLRASVDLHLALMAPFLPRSVEPVEKQGNVVYPARWRR